MVFSISSRKMVPPSASTKRPGWSATAPVKAPFTWPKSSLSSSVSVRAPQSCTTRGMSLRPLSRWMTRASTSLPVPVSPWSSTATRWGAATRTNSSTSRMAGLRKPGSSATSASGEGRGASRARSRSRLRSSSSAARRCSVRRPSSRLAWSTAWRSAPACIGGVRALKIFPWLNSSTSRAGIAGAQ